MREAAADIDDEVARLNRIVNEVLDFARPIQFELAPPTSTRSAASRRRPRRRRRDRRSQLDLDPSLPIVTTDAERLRLALVNLIVNARQAVERADRAGAGRASFLSTRAADGQRVDRRRRHRRRHRAAPICRASSTRTSRPSAAAPASACRSRRTSSRASAARSRVASAPGRGTEIRIDLPLATPRRADAAADATRPPRRELRDPR